MTRSSVVLLAGAIVLSWVTTPALAAPETVVTPAVIAAAKTAADHEAIAKTYDAEAVRLEQEAQTQAELARIYGTYASPKFYSAAMEKQCKQLARDLKASAALNRDLAALHRKVATEMSK